MSSIQQIIDRQLRRWESERLAAIESARRPDQVTPAPPTVTIARQAGVRGKAIAQALADRIGYQVFDKEIVDYIASNHDVRRKLLEMLDEQTVSGIKLWAEGMVLGQHVDRGDFVRYLSGTVRAIHLHGRAVIVGRGAHVLLADAPSLRVRLVAPMEARVRELMAQGEYDEAGARRELSESDAARSEFMRSFFQSRWEDPAAYDLTLNVVGLPVDTAAAILEDAMRRSVAARGSEGRATGIA
jgi:cytidylate kinase